MSVDVSFAETHLEPRIFAFSDVYLTALMRAASVVPSEIKLGFITVRKLASNGLLALCSSSCSRFSLRLAG